MIIWTIICLSVVQDTEFQKRWSEVEEGHHLAWAEHITGQDTDARTTWHEFKSAACIHGSSVKANGDTRHDDELWAVVDRGSLGVFVEQFQALDWGDDSDYCWFVDAGPADGNSLGRDAIADIPAGPPTPFRDEAYVMAGQQFIVFFDTSYNEIARYGVNGIGELCSTIDYDDTTGAVAAGTGANAEGGKIILFDEDMNRDDGFFSPSDNWGAGTSEWTACTALRFSTNGDYLYAVGYSVNLYYHMYKFNMSTGVDEWIYTQLGLGAYGMYVDASDNVYINYSYGANQGVNIIDSDGNLTQFHQMYVDLERDVWVDEDNDRIYLSGLSTGTTKASVSAINIDGTNLKRYYTEQELWCVKTYDNYVYACGDRSAYGVGGAQATIYKFDQDLNLLASYDTGAGTTSTHLVQDPNGNLVARVAQALPAAPDQLLLDTDLNLVDTFTLSPGVLDLYGGENAIIPNYDDGTPAVPGTPGIEPNNVGGFDHLLGEEVCVYADGIPLGVFPVTEDANGTVVIDLGAEYDVVIAGINYYSIYESFPLIPQGEYASIKDVKIDFYESMGCNVGVTLDDSVDWTFSYDNFATAIDPVTEIKEAPFVWGIQREPTVYLHIWPPVPLCIRGLYPLLNLSIE